MVQWELDHLPQSRLYQCFPSFPSYNCGSEDGESHPRHCRQQTLDTFCHSIAFFLNSLVRHCGLRKSDSFIGAGRVNCNCRSRTERFPPFCFLLNKFGIGNSNATGQFRWRRKTPNGKLPENPSTDIGRTQQPQPSPKPFKKGRSYKYRQTPIFRHPFFRKQCFSLKYSLVSLPQNFWRFV